MLEEAAAAGTALVEAAAAGTAALVEAAAAGSAALVEAAPIIGSLLLGCGAVDLSVDGSCSGKGCVRKLGIGRKPCLDSTRVTRCKYGYIIIHAKVESVSKAKIKIMKTITQNGSPLVGSVND